MFRSKNVFRLNIRCKRAKENADVVLVSMKVRFETTRAGPLVMRDRTSTSLSRTQFDPAHAVCFRLRLRHGRALSPALA